MRFQPTMLARTTRAPLEALAWTARAARRGVGALVDLALPPTCVACGRLVATPHGLCPTCWGEIHWISRPFCQRLGIPFGHDIGDEAWSATAIANPPPYERARAAAVHDGPARAVVHALKYRDHMETARFMAARMVGAGTDILADADLLVPVPLHRGRLVSRRFNQAAVLARAVSRLTGLPDDPTALRRIRPTKTQVGLTGGERRDNVRGAFRVDAAAKPRLTGAKVVLVDDVITTGATIEASTRALTRAGVARVDVLAFARVVPGMGETI